MADDPSFIEETSDIKTLIKIQEKRPAFARVISWEIGKATNLQPVKKKRRKKNKALSFGEEVNIAESKETEDAANEHASGEESSEYDTGCEEEEEEEEFPEILQSLESVGSSCTNVTHTDADRGFPSLDVEEVEIGSEVDDVDNEVDAGFQSVGSGMDKGSVTDGVHAAGDAPLGRSRRLSKKQKRKKKKYFRVTYLDELYNLGNFCDTRDEIEEVFTDLSQSGPDVLVQKKIPSLVELCLQANRTKRRFRSNSEKVKNVREDIEVPIGLRRLIASWCFGKRQLEKQLSFFLNRTLPVLEDKVSENEHIPDSFRYDTQNALVRNPTLHYPMRSVWTILPCPPTKEMARGIRYDSQTATAFLFMPSAHYCYDLNYFSSSQMDQFYNEVLTKLVASMSTLATTIDLMLPSHANNTTYHYFRIKRALALRYKHLVDGLFEKVLPYVMWARGHVAVATEMFKNLVEKERSCRYKAMYLSETARMHAVFGDSKTAVLFYKLASETAAEDLAQAENRDKALNELTEQTQILLASVYDCGVLDSEKAQLSYSSWAGTKNIPDVRNASLLAGFDALLCYHLTHWSEEHQYDDAISKLEKMKSACSDLVYYQSLLYALQGSESLSTQTYREFRSSFRVSVVPGASILPMLGRRAGSPWQPLIDVVKGQRSEVRPCRVVWRSTLQPPRIISHRSMEGQVNSKFLNLRVTEEGHVTGDLQMLLPPIRDVSLDPYTGSLLIDSVPAMTSVWQAAYMDRYHWGDLLVPTPLLLYSGSDGTTVHMVKPSNASAAVNELYGTSTTPPSPCMLYWRGPEGQTAKLNLLKVYKDFIKKETYNSLQAKKESSEEGFEMLFKFLDLAYEKDYKMTEQVITGAVHDYVSINKKNEKKGKNEKKKGSSEKPTKGWPKQQLLNCLKVAGDYRYTCLRLLREPLVVGKTLVLHLRGQESSQSSLIVFISTKDKASFQDCVLRNSNFDALILDQGRNNSVEEGFLLVKDNRNIHVFDERGNEVFLLKSLDVGCAERGLLVVGPYIYGTDKNNNSIWRAMIDKGSDDFSVEGIICWTVSSIYEDLAVDPSNPPQIQKITYIGTSQGSATKLLMVNIGIGLVFIYPADMTLVPVTIAEECAIHFEYTDSGMVMKGNFESLKILAEKNFIADGVHTSRMALGVENKVFVLDLTQRLTVEGESAVKLEMICSLALPGFAEEASFVGKEVGLLISLTQHQADDKYYREHVFHYDLEGYLHGVLLCLGRGPRSFCPVYLGGNQEASQSQGQAGWHVYLRDGRDGILCVRLNQ